MSGSAEIPMWANMPRHVQLCEDALIWVKHSVRK